MNISSSSSSSDNEVQSCSTACSKAYEQLHSQYDTQTVEFCKSRLDVLSYQAALESVEARLVVYKQNESILQDNIIMLKNEVEARDNYLITLKQKLNQAEKERDDLELKFDKFQTSSQSLTELLANQKHDKQGLGYSSLENDSESLSPSCPSDRLQPSGGYNVVPTPITGNFMPLKPDLIFHTAPIAVETAHSAFTVKLSSFEPTQDLPHTNIPSAPIIEEWVSDSEDDSETTAPQIAHSSVQSTKQVTYPRHYVQPVKAPILTATPKPTSLKSNRSGKRNNRKTCFVCRSVDHLIKDYNFHAKPQTQPTPRNYAHRGFNKQHALLQPRHAYSIDTKSKSAFRRHMTSGQSPKTSNSPPRVTTAQAPVVNAAKGKKGKWVWRPKCPTLDHDFRTTSASMILKQFDYIDAQGRSKGNRGQVMNKEILMRYDADYELAARLRAEEQR
nr:hypothetical protein [Tanacetum cinerariifolium]